MIQLQQLQLGYDRERPVTPVPLNLTIPTAQLFVILGANGSGKSTLLETMIGAHRAVSGSVQVNGKSVASLNPSELARHFAYVPQNAPFPPDMSLFDLICLGFLPKLGMFGQIQTEDRQLANRLATEIGIGPLVNHKLGSVSAGERQKAFLARALVQDAAVLVLDEPTSSLDPGATRRFWHSLDYLVKNQQRTIVVATHDVHNAPKFASHLLALKRGCVEFSGPVQPANWPTDVIESLYD